jgi:hypothetical protein
MRKPKGQVAISLNLAITVFVVGSLGLVAFEFSRILLARDQLKHCLELSALAGGATMASTSLNTNAAQQEATTVATNILKMNSILGQNLSPNVGVVANQSQLTPTAGKLMVTYEFDDPITKLPSATGSVLKVYGAYAYPLLSGGFGAIGVSVYTLVAQVSAGLPSVDMVVVYSNDAAMDDQAPVTMVRRYWDPTVPNIAYYIPNPGSPSNGSISGLVCSPMLGTDVNGLPPQNLDAAGDPKTANCPKQFSETGPTGKTMPLRGLTNTGTAPGDAPPSVGGMGLQLNQAPGNTRDSFAYDPQILNRRGTNSWLRQLASRLSNIHLEQPAEAWFTAGPNFGTGSYNPWNADPSMFTDLVVNIDGNSTFGGVNSSSGAASSSFTTFSFPDISYLVEASRGNLENNGIGPNVHVDNSLASSSVPGYQQAYQCLAYQCLEPKTTLETALRNFMTKVQQTSNCHFAFVAFNDRAGLSPTDSLSSWNVSWAYPVAGLTSYLLPKIPLAQQSNQAKTISTLLTPPTNNVTPLFVPNGGSNLADGLQQAYNELTGPNSRTGAMKVIVLVTDKVPDRDLAGNVYTTPGSNGPALSDALTVASLCKQQGIPIFTMAVDQTGGQMTPFFQSQFSDTATGGLVNTAGSGGALYINNFANKTSGASTFAGNFNNIVRQLTALLRG